MSKLLVNCCIATFWWNKQTFEIAKYLIIYAYDLCTTLGSSEWVQSLFKVVIVRSKFSLFLFHNVKTKHRRLRSDYLSSDPWKNYPSATEGIFRLVWIILSTDAKERAGFPSFLASRAPRSKADFSTLKFQLLIVRLSQDLVSVDIFKMKTTVSIESKFSDEFM